MKAGAPSPTELRPSHLRLVQGVPLRISVVGTRGRSTLAGLVAAALRRRGHATHCNVPRAPLAVAQRPFLRAAAAAGLAAGDAPLLAAARADVQANWPSGATGALVLANHARSPAAIRAFHATVCVPHYVLLTNVRNDPAGLLPRSLVGVARSLVHSATPGSVLVSGESDPPLRLALRRECERLGIPFVDAAPRRPEFPGAEILSVLDAMLLHRFGKGLSDEEMETARRDLMDRFRWSSSSLAGVRWFNAGPLHDVDSTQLALSYLQAPRRTPVTFVAYFRPDRPGRTRAYVPFLKQLLRAPDTRQVILCGHRAEAVAERLRAWSSQVRVVPDDLAEIPRLLRRFQSECQGGAIVTLASGAPEWPQELAKALQRTPPPGVGARPTRQEATAAVPRRIVRPRVAPAAVAGAQLEPDPDAPMPVALPPAPTPQQPARAPAAAMAPLPAATVLVRPAGGKADAARPA